jgi:dipeptide/tripeptide permease
VFVWGQKFFGHIGLPPAKAAAVAKAEEEGKKPETKDLTLDTKDWTHVGIITAICCAIVWGTLFSWKWVGPVFDKIPWYVQLLFGLGLLAGLVVRTGGKKSGIEWQRVAVIAILCFFNIFFWMGFEQAGGTMTLFADTQTDRNLGWVRWASSIVGLFLGAASTSGARPASRPTPAASGSAVTGLFVLTAAIVAGPGIWSSSTRAATRSCRGAVPGDQPAAHRGARPALLEAVDPSLISGVEARRRHQDGHRDDRSSAWASS